MWHTYIEHAKHSYTFKQTNKQTNKNKNKQTKEFGLLKKNPQQGSYGRPPETLGESVLGQPLVNCLLALINRKPIVVHFMLGLFFLRQHQ